MNGTTGVTYSNGSFLTSQGYAISYEGIGSEIISFNGVPYTSNQTIAITQTPSSTFESWNLIGNPFCSTLAGNSNAEITNNFIDANSLQLHGDFAAVYLWNEKENYQGNRDDYIIFSNSTTARFIEVGQAFMVKSKPEGGLITFNPNIRNHDTATFHKNTLQGEVSRFYMSAGNDEGLYNEILIAFMDGMTKGLDKTYDAGKLKGNPDIALYSKLVEDNGVDFAHQALPPLTNKNEEVKIGFDVSTAGTYVFKIKELENFDEIISIKLEDKQDGNIIDFREAGEYVFTVNEPGEIRTRFVLHFNAAVGIEEQIQADNLRFYVYNNKLYIIDEDLKKGVVQLYNLLGQPVMEKRYYDRVSTIDHNLPAAYYIVRIITEKNSISGKIYLK